jgi:two-component system LytT family response regulator
MIQKITAIIVEDEDAALKALQRYIQKFCPQVQLIGAAHNCNEAIEVIHACKPQLVFLDVEMPFGNAFDVLDGCKDISFETIFVTAFSEYSLRALNQSASYYLLKPVSIEELIIAVNKVQQQLHQKQFINRNQILVDNSKEVRPEKQQIILPTLDGFDVVKMEEIVRLKGNGNFTDVFLQDGSKKMVCRFLKHFTEMLPYPFIRIHKSHVINIHFVKSYHKGTGGYVILNDGAEVEVSAGYKDAFLELFK